MNERTDSTSSNHVYKGLLPFSCLHQCHVDHFTYKQYAPEMFSFIVNCHFWHCFHPFLTYGASALHTSILSEFEQPSQLLKILIDIQTLFAFLFGPKLNLDRGTAMSSYLLTCTRTFYQNQDAPLHPHITGKNVTVSLWHFQHKVFSVEPILWTYEGVK